MHLFIVVVASLIDEIVFVFVRCGYYDRVVVVTLYIVALIIGVYCLALNKELILLFVLNTNRIC